MSKQKPKQLKGRKQNYRIPIRFFCIIIIPFLISYLWLFSPNQKIDLRRDVSKENETVASIEYKFMEEPGVKKFIGDIFSVPLNLDWYVICFEDRGSYALYIDGTKDYDITWFVNFNDESNLTVHQNDKNCTDPIKIDKTFKYDWRGIFEVKLTYEHTVTAKQRGYVPFMTFHPDTISYAQPERLSAGTKVLLFILAWASVAWLISRIRKLILFGWDI